MIAEKMAAKIRHCVRLLMSLARIVQSVARYLISKSANVEATDGNGRTALMLASFAGHKECVALLLGEGGANVNFCNESGKTALAEALH